MLAFMLLQTTDLPPANWSALAPVPYVSAPQMTPPLSRFVAAEIASGRCAAPKPADGRYSLKVDVAALVRPDGTIRKVVPHAIDCPTVEQYSVGLVESFARANLKPAGAAAIWYRATLIYEWAG